MIVCIVPIPVSLGMDELKVDYKDTLAVSKIASACEKAARTGGAVELKWEPEELPATKNTV